MITEVRFNDFVAFAPTVVILKVAPKKGFYEVEHYRPRPAQTDLFATVPDPLKYCLTEKEDLTQPPRFTFDTDPIGCEKRANAWGSRGKK